MLSRKLQTSLFFSYAKFSNNKYLDDDKRLAGNNKEAISIIKPDSKQQQHHPASETGWL